MPISVGGYAGHDPTASPTALFQPSVRYPFRTFALLSALETLQLMDAVDPDLVDAAETAVGDVPGVRSVESVRLRWIGHRMRAEITLTVDNALSVVEAHAIADEAPAPADPPRPPPR